MIRLATIALGLTALVATSTTADAWYYRYRNPWWNTGPRIVGPLISTPQPFFPVPRVGPPIYGPTAGAFGGPIQAPAYTSWLYGIPSYGIPAYAPPTSWQYYGPPRPLYGNPGYPPAAYGRPGPDPVAIAAAIAGVLRAFSRY